MRGESVGGVGLVEGLEDMCEGVGEGGCDSSVLIGGRGAPACWEDLRTQSKRKHDQCKLCKAVENS